MNSFWLESIPEKKIALLCRLIKLEASECATSKSSIDQMPFTDTSLGPENHIFPQFLDSDSHFVLMSGSFRFLFIYFPFSLQIYPCLLQKEFVAENIFFIFTVVWCQTFFNSILLKTDGKKLYIVYF